MNLVQKVLRPLEELNTNQWLVCYLLAACVVALKITYNQHGWLNSDSLLYFEQARLILLGEFEAAAKLLSWLLYPSLIACTVWLTTLDIHTAAQALNIIFFLIFTWGYNRLLESFGADRTTLHFGNLLMLSSPYIVGDVLGMLLRDEGFWASFVWGLVFFIRYANQSEWKNALFFQISFIFATLFRIEGAVYLLSLPIFMGLISLASPRQRFLSWVKMSSLSLFFIMSVSILVTFRLIELKSLGRLQELYILLHDTFTKNMVGMQQKTDIIASQVLGHFLDEYAKITLWGVLILITLFKTIKVAGWPVAILVCIGNKKWWNELQPLHRQISIALLSLGFIISLVNILNVFVLSGRYVISSGILLLTLSAFVLRTRLNQFPQWRKTVILLLSVLVLFNLIDRKQPDLNRQSVDFLQKINMQNKLVFYDTENARFYAKQPYLDRIEGVDYFKQILASEQLEKFAFYVITTHEKDQTYATLAKSVLTKYGFCELHTLYGWRKKTIAVIYTKENCAQLARHLDPT